MLSMFFGFLLGGAVSAPVAVAGMYAVTRRSRVDTLPAIEQNDTMN